MVRAATFLPTLYDSFIRCFLDLAQSNNKFREDRTLHSEWSEQLPSYQHYDSFIRCFLDLEQSNYKYIYLLTPLQGQDMTKGQFLSEV